jgi:acyl transferase domain-containing protein
VAAQNGPLLTVVGGPEAQIAEFEQRLNAAAVTSRRLRVGQAFHTPMMRGARQALDELARQLPRQASRIRYISNLTGSWMSDGDWEAGDYWGRHLCGEVKYWPGIEAMMQAREPQVLVEVGPGQMMSSLARQAGGRQMRVLSTMPRALEPEAEAERLLKAVAGMWIDGVEIKWESYYEGEQRRRVELPVTVFERQRYWLEGGASGQPARPAAAPAQPPRPELAHWFYVPTWKRLPLINLSELDRLKQHKKVWLIFKDRCGLGLELAGELESLGQQVISVECGEKFEKIDANAYAINPRQAEDYEALLQSLSSSHRFPDEIVHLWSVTEDDPAAADLDLYDPLLARGFFSLLLLAQAFAASPRLPHLRLFVIANHLAEVSGLEPLAPLKATLLGPCKVIPQEFDQISCRLFDVTSPPLTDSSWQPLARHLLADFAAASGPPLVAWRGPHRWVQAFEPVHLLPDDLQLNFTHAGLYLITGGLGGIGLALAEALVRDFDARLILTTRSDFPPRPLWPQWLDQHPCDDRTSRRIRQLQLIDPNGSAIAIETADAADLPQMRALFDRLNRRHAQLNGVIHAAGLAGGALIEGLSLAAAAAVLRAKVKGALVLAELLGHQPVDFVAYCSSVSALLGGIGEADYSAANACLDHLALQGRRLGQHRLAINWGVWKEVGLAVETAVPEPLRPWRQRQLEAGISPAEGIEAFKRLLGRLDGQVVVTPEDFQAQLQWHQQFKLAQAVAEIQRWQQQRGQHQRPKLSSTYAAPASDVERRLAGIWEELLGIERLGGHDNFFELGGHSLLGAQMMTRVRKAFAVELGLRALFEAPTIAQLALVIEDKLIDDIGKVIDDDHEYLT